MKNVISFWGVRGSTPVCGERFIRYGGHTSCVSVKLINYNEMIIFDAGSGIVDLGEYIIDNNITTAHLFISHLHSDHVIGLPMFRPIHCRNFKLHIYSDHINIENFFEKTLFNAQFFPVQWQDLSANIVIHKVQVGQTINLDDAQITSIALNHPGGAIGYRIHTNNYSLCYLTDHEHGNDKCDQNIIEFMQGCDNVILDATYSCKDYEMRQGWGHTTNIAVANFAYKAQIKQLILFHHAHDYDDLKLDNHLKEAQAIFPATVAAQQNMIIEF